MREGRACSLCTSAPQTLTRSFFVASAGEPLPLPCACDSAAIQPCAVVGRRRHWLTLDKGEHYTALDAAFAIKDVKMHPTEPQWMLASRLADGCRGALERVNCSLEVYVSVDLGRQWRHISSYVAQFEWAPTTEQKLIRRGHSRETIFLVQYDLTSGNQPFGVWSARARFVRSDDLWRTHFIVLHRGNRFLFLDKFLFVAVVNAHHESQVPALPLHRVAYRCCPRPAPPAPPHALPHSAL